MTNTLSPTTDKRRRQRAWERRKEQRPGELLDAALDIFVARGFAAARLDDVAARAGVSKGTLYLYYAGKEDLFKAVVRVKIIPVIEQFRHTIDQANGSSEELMVEVLQGWWNCFSKPQIGGIMKLILSEASNFPEIARFFNDEVASTSHAVIRQLVQRGIERQEFRQTCDLDTTAHLIMAPLILKLVWTYSVGRCCSPLVDPANFIRHHAELILMLLRANQSTPATVAGPYPPASDAKDPAFGHQTGQEPPADPAHRSRSFFPSSLPTLSCKP
ncbi:MAG: TetR/AcrR family transcriptional regulator [Lautropia sp.]|nr:TetR/AcrR family transcriptional regulator [Lautropia sp.]